VIFSKQNNLILPAILGRVSTKLVGSLKRDAYGTLGTGPESIYGQTDGYIPTLATPLGVKSQLTPLSKWLMILLTLRTCARRNQLSIKLSVQVKLSKYAIYLSLAVTKKIS
jgi:hypothetical protein